MRNCQADSGRRILINRGKVKAGRARGTYSKKGSYGDTFQGGVIVVRCLVRGRLLLLYNNDSRRPPLDSISVKKSQRTRERNKTVMPFLASNGPFLLLVVDLSPLYPARVRLGTHAFTTFQQLFHSCNVKSSVTYYYLVDAFL